MTKHNLSKNKNSNIGKIYQARTLYKLIVGSLLGFAGLFLIISSFLATQKYHHSYGGPTFLGFALIVCCVAYLQNWYSHRGIKIQLLEDGLDVTNKNLNKMKIYWNEIIDINENNVQSVFAKIIMTTYGYTITTINGTKINVDSSIKEIKELIQLIQNKIYELQFPRYKEIYNRGETIYFGKLSLSQSGITKESKNIIWEDIRKVKVEDCVVRIYIKGKTFSWDSISTSEISNYFVFVSFINEIMSAKEKPSLSGQSTITKQTENISISTDAKEPKIISNNDEDLHVSASEKKKALESVIISNASDLAEEIISIIDGGLINLHKEFNSAAVYIEMIYLFINELMDTAPQYLKKEEENHLFVGTIYKIIGRILANRYSLKNNIKTFITFFEDTFEERRMEYKNFVGLKSNSWKEDLLYLSFGKKISEILEKTFDLETDADIQNLFTIAFFPIPWAKKHMESIKDKGGSRLAPPDYVYHLGITRQIFHKWQIGYLPKIPIDYRVLAFRRRS